MVGSKSTRTSIQLYVGDKSLSRSHRRKTKRETKSQHVDGKSPQSPFSHQNMNASHEDAPDVFDFSTMKDDDEIAFNFNNLDQSLPMIPQQLSSLDRAMNGSATADEKEHMLDRILSLTNQLAEISAAAIVDEENGDDREANVEGGLLAGKYRDLQADCFAQKAFRNYFYNLPTSMRQFNARHLCIFVDLQVVSFKLACANNLELSLDIIGNDQKVSNDQVHFQIFSFFQTLLGNGEDWNPEKVMAEARKVDRAERKLCKRSAVQGSGFPLDTKQVSTKKERQIEAARISIEKQTRGDQEWFQTTFDKFLEDMNAARSAKASRRRERKAEKTRERHERGINKQQQKLLHAERRETDLMLSDLIGDMGVVDQNKKSQGQFPTAD